jgi:hypothetical protein
MSTSADALLATLADLVADRVAQRLASRLPRATAGEQISAAEFLDERGVEKHYGLRRRTLQSWRARGYGPPWTHAGRRVLYARIAVEQFLNGGGALRRGRVER